MEVFKLVNGKRSAKEISRKSGKNLSSTLHDLQKMNDLELISPKTGKNGNTLKKENSVIYVKAPLILHIPLSYFTDATKITEEEAISKKLTSRSKAQSTTALHVPNETEILDICRGGEDQIHEFKAAGVEVQKLTKEIAAFANTKFGGMIFYGVEDDGTISGSDKRRQELDQQLQNSVRNAILPSLAIDIAEKDVLGHKIIVVRIPPWNRKDVYQYEGRVHIRLGTNVFIAKPEQSRKLYSGVPIV